MGSWSTGVMWSTFDKVFKVFERSWLTKLYLNWASAKDTKTKWVNHLYWMPDWKQMSKEKIQNGVELRRERIGNTDKNSHYHFYDNYVSRLITEIQVDREVSVYARARVCVCVHMHSELRTFTPQLYNYKPRKKKMYFRHSVKKRSDDSWDMFFSQCISLLDLKLSAVELMLKFRNGVTIFPFIFPNNIQIMQKLGIVQHVWCRIK